MHMYIHTYILYILYFYSYIYNLEGGEVLLQHAEALYHALDVIYVIVALQMPADSIVHFFRLPHVKHHPRPVCELKGRKASHTSSLRPHTLVA